MGERRIESAGTILAHRNWEALHSLLQDLAEKRDLDALASIAETGLATIRRLCERPVTCAELDGMLASLRHLNLTPLEPEEE